MFKMPVVISKTMPPTTRTRLTRSRNWATDRHGGQSNSLGMTDHSLARTTGTSTRPSMTCTPSRTRYNQLGFVTQSKRYSPKSPFAEFGGLPSLGS